MRDPVGATGGQRAGEVATTAVAFAEDDRAKEDLKALAGTWQYTSQEEDGKETDRESLKAVTVSVTV